MSTEPTYEIRLQQVGPHWFWSVERTDWSGAKTGLVTQVVDGDMHFVDAATAAFDAQQQIARMRRPLAA